MATNWNVVGCSNPVNNGSSAPQRSSTLCSRERVPRCPSTCHAQEGRIGALFGTCFCMSRERGTMDFSSLPARGILSGCIAGKQYEFRLLLKWPIWGSGPECSSDSTECDHQRVRCCRDHQNSRRATSTPTRGVGHREWHWF